MKVVPSDGVETTAIARDPHGRVTALALAYTDAPPQDTTIYVYTNGSLSGVIVA